MFKKLRGKMRSNLSNIKAMKRLCVTVISLFTCLDNLINRKCTNCQLHALTVLLTKSPVMPRNQSQPKSGKYKPAYDGGVRVCARTSCYTSLHFSSTACIIIPLFHYSSVLFIHPLFYSHLRPH